jgi:hypothetical protein
VSLEPRQGGDMACIRSPLVGTRGTRFDDRAGERSLLSQV